MHVTRATDHHFTFLCLARYSFSHVSVRTFVGDVGVRQGKAKITCMMLSPISRAGRVLKIPRNLLTCESARVRHDTKTLFIGRA